MSDQWYVFCEGQQNGPYTWEEIIHYAREGNIKKQDLLWSQSTLDWVPADQVSGLNFPDSPLKKTFSPKKKVALAIGGSFLLLVLVVFLMPFLFNNISVGGEDEIYSWILPEHEEYMKDIDDSDWENYPDLQEEKKAIARTMKGFGEALATGDPDATTPYIFDDRQESYRELFRSNPEAMESFGEIISQAEISFLSEHDESTPDNRTAEYSLEIDGFTFYLIFMKVNDEWFLYDF